MDKLMDQGALPIGEQFALWALRQWHHDHALTVRGSVLHRGFERAGLLALLPDFAVAMDAFLFGASRAMEIREPTSLAIGHDEATVVALCGLAQGDFEGVLAASLERLMAPAASREAAIRLKILAVSLGNAGLRLALEPGAAADKLN